jgi:hypothetical protein
MQQEMLRFVTAPVGKAALAVVLKETIPDSPELLSSIEQPRNRHD